MSSVEGNYRTFQVGATQIPAFSAVKLASGLLVAATAGTDPIIGVIGQIGYANQNVDVRLRASAGSFQAVAGGTIAINDAITATTAGAVITTTTTGNQILGYAISAATSGNLVEYVPSTAKY